MPVTVSCDWLWVAFGIDDFGANCLAVGNFGFAFPARARGPDRGADEWFVLNGGRPEMTSLPQGRDARVNLFVRIAVDRIFPRITETI
ncbi:hypothetical protein JQ634_12840 [Bradyrhizobium sp. AUGA SZCCT0240]|uniref:hypothetical protein n=1 Tax=unclassified Bradyrhizobium TaxID=2631580 RepID=UPI001BAD948F|nr:MULTISPECIES: hypothetical protein [unclassified Bradyrhizobium]MBR1197552.1 hypothetical protein [Bradyrhizobium sp. AUGA SZCCT0158]MBR1244291.1 hypothetical protein [Bradyrhizobium sp. AUGA SZCCT0274]MBR1254588.1 hypothetical protein [Bradyrhizobium sp. AUGA SZCCT0240]